MSGDLLRVMILRVESDGHRGFERRQILKSLPAVVESDARLRLVAAGRIRHRAAAAPAVAIDEDATLARRRGGQRCRRAFQAEELVMASNLIREREQNKNKLS